MSCHKISIIIPVYNLENVVSDCIVSCINQTFSDIEIIIVNDGSTDGSTAIIDNFAQKDSRIRHIIKKNEGLSKARVTGIEHATGEFIFHLDGDDSIPHNALEKLLTVAQLHNADIVTGDVQVVKKQEVKYDRYSAFTGGSGYDFLQFILLEKLHYIWGKLIRRSLYSKHKFEIVTEIKTVPSEDQIHLLQLCPLASRVYAIEDIVYLYRISENSITQRKTDTRDYVMHCEYFAFMQEKLLYKSDYTTPIKMLIYRDTLEMLYLGLIKHGSFVVDKKKSRALLRRTIFKAIFSKQTMLFGNFNILYRCMVALLFPKLPFLLTKLH